MIEFEIPKKILELIKNIDEIDFCINNNEDIEIRLSLIVLQIKRLNEVFEPYFVSIGGNISNQPLKDLIKENLVPKFEKLILSLPLKGKKESSVNLNDIEYKFSFISIRSYRYREDFPDISPYFYHAIKIGNSEQEQNSKLNDTDKLISGKEYFKKLVQNNKFNLNDRRHYNSKENLEDEILKFMNDLNDEFNIKYPPKPLKRGSITRYIKEALGRKSLK